jgi:hypothetical protein
VVKKPTTGDLKWIAMAIPHTFVTLWLPLLSDNSLTCDLLPSETSLLRNPIARKALVLPEWA